MCRKPSIRLEKNVSRVYIQVLVCLTMLMSELEYSQPLDTAKDAADVLNRFVLVRPPGFIENCSVKAKSDAILVLPTRIPKVELGRKYQILTQEGELVASSV